MSAMVRSWRRNLGLGNYVKEEEDEGLGLNLGLDRISELPEAILSHIFSYLSTEDYAKTMLLSKTWSSFWSPRPVLELDFKSFCSYFDISDPGERKKRFTHFVARMAVLHKGIHLQELKFGFDVTVFEGSSSVIHNWIMLASTSNPSTLDLKVYGIDVKAADLSKFLCYCVGQSVTVLKLTWGSFVSRNLFLHKGFESVKTLILNKVNLPQDSISYLIRKCPVLEELHIVRCHLPFRLYIYATDSKLQRLDLESRYGCPLRGLTINIPSLVKFKFKGKMLEDFVLDDSRNVIEAQIYFSGGYDVLHKHTTLHKLLAGIDNVNTLTLCTCSLKLNGSRDLLPNEDELLQPRLNNLKNITVIACRGCSKLMGCYELKGLAYLLKRCPYLESLSISLEPKLLKDIVDLDRFVYFYHLKKVEIAGFEGNYSQLEFVKYLLENALVLERMIIYKPTRESQSTFDSLVPTSEKGQPQEKAIYEVLAFQRACPDAQVLIL